MSVQNTEDYPNVVSWEKVSDGGWVAVSAHYGLDMQYASHPETAPGSPPQQQELVAPLNEVECQSIQDSIEAVFASHRVPVRFDYESDGHTTIFTPRNPVSILTVMVAVTQMREAGHRITSDFKQGSHDFTLRYGAGVKLRSDVESDE